MPLPGSVPAHESKTRRKELKAYCYSLIERTEEALSAYLSSGAKHHEGACCVCYIERRRALPGSCVLCLTSLTRRP